MEIRESVKVILAMLVILGHINRETANKLLDRANERLAYLQLNDFTIDELVDVLFDAQAPWEKVETEE